MNIDLRLMEHALALAEHRNFARAARALELSQPTLTRSIQDLERRLSIRVFERTHSGVEPTDAGLLFLDRARGVLASSRDMVREIALMRGLAGDELQIGAGTYVAETLVAEAMARTLSAHPGVRMRVAVDHWASQMAMLRRREIDLAVAALVEGQDNSGMEVVPLGRQQGYFIVRAGHKLTQLATPTLSDIVGYPLLSVARLPPRVITALLGALPKSGGQRPSNVRLPTIGCDSQAMMRTIAAGSDAVAVMALSPALLDIQAGRVAALPLVEPEIASSFGIFRLIQRGLPRVAEEFSRILQMVDQETVERETRIYQDLFGPQRPHGKRRSQK